MMTCSWLVKHQGNAVPNSSCAGMHHASPCSYVQRHHDTHRSVRSYQDPETDSNRPYLTVKPLAEDLKMNPGQAERRDLWTPPGEQVQYFNNAYRKKEHKVAHVSTPLIPPNASVSAQSGHVCCEDKALPYLINAVAPFAAACCLHKAYHNAFSKAADVRKTELR